MIDKDKLKIKEVVGEILNPHPNTQTLHFTMLITLIACISVASFAAGYSVGDSHDKGHINDFKVINHTFAQMHENHLLMMENYESLTKNKQTIFRKAFTFPLKY